MIAFGDALKEEGKEVKTNKNTVSGGVHRCHWRVIDWTDPKLAAAAGAVVALSVILLFLLGQRGAFLFVQAIPTVPFKLT